MFKLRRVAYTVLAAGLVVPTAQAVDEITVSAQRRDANLQEVPIAVTAISAEDIEKLQINFVADIAKNVPNLQTYTVTAGAAAMQVFMRGAGVQNPGFNASEAPVGIYIDDVYRGRVGTANLELADVERIEVLRGPQGTLYGRNNIAGAIKVITRTPGEEFYSNGSVGYGTYDTYKVTGAVGGEVADGLGMSIAGLYNKRGNGWITRGPFNAPNVTRDLGEYDNIAVRSKLNWFGDEDFSAVATLEYVDAENDGYNAIPYMGDPAVASMPLGGFYQTFIPDSNKGLGRTKQANATLDLSWELGGATLRSITGYSDIKDRFRFDINGGVSTTPGQPAVGGLLIQSIGENSTFTQEFTLSGDTESFDWITGIYFLKERGDQDYNAGLGALVESSKTDTQSYAIFGEGTWSITEKMSLTAGARWTLDDKDYRNTCTGFFCGGGWTNDIGDNFNEFTPRLIVDWQHNENVSTYASISRGFQAGGFQTLCFGNQACNQVIYDPQTVVSYETGMKADMLDNTLRINWALFYAQYDNLQQTAIDPVSLSFPVQNVGDVDVTGLEIEIDWAATENLNLFATLGLVDEDFGSGVTGVGDPLDGTSRLPGLPRNTLVLGGDYTITAPLLPADWGLDLVVGADMNYADDYFATINNVLEIPSYTRFNARVGLEQKDGPWSIFASGTNITDENDLFSGIYDPVQGINIRTVQEPRMLMLTVNYKN